MNFSKQMAKGFRAAYYGGNWTAVNLRKELEDVNLEMAVKSIGQHNTIATLVFHLHYYVKSMNEYLQGKPLVMEDKLSFSHPNFSSDIEWKSYIEKVLKEGEEFAKLVENMQDEKMFENYRSEAKYGDYYRILQGITEHVFYHLGQIVLLKRLMD